jgi:manganese-dependent inorganic pyrophosphatase
VADIIVTSYRNPDLDGIACSIGYSQLLCLLGHPSHPTYYGSLGLEVDFVRNYCNSLPIKQQSTPYQQDTQFVLVDTADPDAIDPHILPEQVFEVYDHRKVVFTDKFPNAQAQIDLVGSCATIITEKYIENGQQPNSITALYLYSAIISNTINFQNTVTTDRDKQAASWLQQFLHLPSDFIERMFIAKSHITPANLQASVMQDFAVKEITGFRVGLAQLEVANLDQLLNQVESQLTELLRTLKSEKNLDFILFTGIDILKGGNRFLVVDPRSEKLYSGVLNTKFIQGRGSTPHIIMRKQMWPLIETDLKNFK